MHKVFAYAVSSLCPVSFSSPVTMRLPSTTFSSTHTGQRQESVDQWSVFLPAQWPNRQHASLLLWMQPTLAVYHAEDGAERTALTQCCVAAAIITWRKIGRCFPAGMTATVPLGCILALTWLCRAV